MKGTVTIPLEDYTKLIDYQNNLLKRKDEEWLEYFSPLNKKKIFISKCQAIENLVLENNEWEKQVKDLTEELEIRKQALRTLTKGLNVR